MAAGVIGLAAAAALHLATWRSFPDFMRRTDKYRLLFADFVLQYRPAAQEILTSGAPYPGYYYSAFFALLLAPLVGVSEPAALWLWGGVQIAATLLLAILSVRFSPPGFAGVALFVFFTSAPILHNFKWGQVSVLVTLLVYASFLALQSRRALGAAMLLAFAAATKYYPALFLLPLVTKARARFLFLFGGFFALFFFVIPAVILGPEKSLEFLRLSRESWSRDSARHMVDINSQYFPHLVERWQQALRGPFAPISAEASTQRRALAAASLAVFAGAALAARRAWARGTPREAVRSASLLFAVVPFLLPTSWPHYFAFLPCAQVIAMGDVLSEPTAARRALFGAILLISILLGSMVPFAFVTGWRTYSYLGGPFLAGVLVFLILVRGASAKDCRPAQ
ncbi:MAG TPA: glycosyltransferase family 87 protein [bacterium]|nr:glycosyltransferase family 87 protein [bacterium]